MRRYKLTEKQLDKMEDRRLMSEFYVLIDRECLTELDQMGDLAGVFLELEKMYLATALLAYHMKSREINRKRGMIE